MRHVWVFGTTEPQDFQLTDDGANIVGTGLTLGIEFREDGVSATVAWLSRETGTVRVSSVTGMTAGKTYHFRFTLTDSESRIGYCPNGDSADEWYVARV